MVMRAILLWCLLAFASFGFSPPDTCTKKNDYLEDQLTRIYAKRLENEKSKTCERPGSAPLGAGEIVSFGPFPAECIYASMKKVGMEAPVYWKCGEDDKMLSSTKMPKPCLSEKYVSYVHENFLKAMECAGLDPYETFPLISEESGFQLNVGNGGAGIGQQNSGSVNGLNEGKFVEKILKERSEQCKPLLELMRKSDGTLMTRIDSRYPCQYVALPYNPGLALLYFGAFYLDARSKVEKLLKSWNRNRYNEEELNKITAWLTRMCYAAGMNCGEVLREFSGMTAYGKIPVAAIPNHLHKASISAGLKAEERTGKTKVFGGQTKELIANFTFKIERVLKDLGNSQDGEDLAKKCSERPADAEQLQVQKLKDQAN